MTIVTHSIFVRRPKAGLRAHLIRTAWRIRRFVNNLVAAALARRERQVALFALRQMSDRELKDLGLYRGDLERAVSRKTDR